MSTGAQTSAPATEETGNQANIFGYASPRDEMIVRRARAEKRGRELMREYGRNLSEAGEQFARNMAYAETVTELTGAWSDMQMIREGDRSIRISKAEESKIKKIFNVRASELGYKGRM